MRLAWITVVALVACGGSSEPSPARHTATGPFPSPPASADDLEVARVNGRPVWSSCVIAQAKQIALPAKQPSETRDDATRLRELARAQCIDFELMAQAAEARGLASAPEVDETTRAALVNRLVELDFEAHYKTPSDLGAAIEAIITQSRLGTSVPELRSSAFARFVVDKDASPEVDAQARALADKLAAELANATGMFGVHLIEAAKHIAAGSPIKLDAEDVKPMIRPALIKAYGDALYAIPEVGRIAAQPIRTPWGWDVILWTGGTPAAEHTHDELVALVFPEARRRQFKLWSQQIAKSLGIAVTVDQAQLERDEEVEDQPSKPTAPAGPTQGHP